MKNIWKYCFLPLLLGVLTGVGVGMFRFYAWPHVYANMSANRITLQDVPPEALVPAPPQSDSLPKAEVDVVKDFGFLPEGQTEVRHDFLIKNTGGATLQLQEISTSCHCTVAELSKDELNPGESATVRVELKLAGLSGYFEQTATFFTNDPAMAEIQLCIKGTITVPVWLDAMEVSAGRILENTAGQTEIRMFDREPQPVTMTSFEFSDPQLAPFFDVSQQPLPEAEVKAADERASHGAILIVTVKPGMPLGAFQQTLTIHTSSVKQKQLNVRIHGIIGNQVAVFGPGWNEDAGTLTFQHTKQGQQVERTLMIHAKGENHAEYRFSVKQVFPEFVRVELAPPYEMDGSDLSVTKITITIPADAPKCNYLTGNFQEMGYILLDTAKTPTPLRIYLRFMVI